MRSSNPSRLLTLFRSRAFPGLAPCEAASTEVVHIQPTSKDNFATASFLLHVPRKVRKPRYILVLVPGLNGDGGWLLRDGQWSGFAEQTGGAIVACTFVKRGQFVHYAAAQHGSGTALESAIEQLDTKDSLHSLKDLPVLIYGHSAGGQFAYGFSCHNPTRMIGFAAVKGGCYYPEPIDETYRVPGLMISGRKDLTRRRTAIRGLFELHRAKGASWCWMEDSSGHDQANVLYIVIPYFRELLRLQLRGRQKGFPDRSKLVGIVVDLVDKRILSERKAFGAQDTNLKQGWLPSKSVFELWSQLDTGMMKYSEQEDLPDKK